MRKHERKERKKEIEKERTKDAIHIPSVRLPYKKAEAVRLMEWYCVATTGLWEVILDDKSSSLQEGEEIPYWGTRYTGPSMRKKIETPINRTQQQHNNQYSLSLVLSVKPTENYKGTI